MKRFYVFLMTLMLLLGLSVSGHATLINMGDGTIYDTDLQLTWLQDANYASTSGYDADGKMTWGAANSWADNLVFATFDNWRLPSALNQDGTGPCTTLYNCTGSEMGHLFYTELGNEGGPTRTNDGDFTNMPNTLSQYYWSGTEYALDTNQAWLFSLVFGGQDTGNKANGIRALAVRPGDRSTTSSVPEPATFLLLGSGLAGIAVWRKRLGRKEG